MPDLRLIKTDVIPSVEQLIVRMQSDVLLLQMLSVREVRALYSELEGMRDAISKLLDRADGKR